MKTNRARKPFRVRAYVSRNRRTPARQPLTDRRRRGLRRLTRHNIRVLTRESAAYAAANGLPPRVRYNRVVRELYYVLPINKRHRVSLSLSLSLSLTLSFSRWRVINVILGGPPRHLSGDTTSSEVEPRAAISVGRLHSFRKKQVVSESHPEPEQAGRGQSAEIKTRNCWKTNSVFGHVYKVNHVRTPPQNTDQK